MLTTYDQAKYFIKFLQSLNRLQLCEDNVKWFGDYETLRDIERVGIRLYEKQTKS